MSARGVNDARAVAFVAVVVLLAGYVFVFRTGEERIADQLAQNEHLGAQITADQAILHARSQLERDDAVMRSRVRAVDLYADGTRTVASFLRDAARAAARHRTTFAAISSAVQPTSGAASATAPQQFSTVPLDVTLEGRYVDVLATMRELSANRVPASVDVAGLARKTADVNDATLTATLRVTLERRPLPETYVRPRQS